MIYDKIKEAVKEFQEIQAVLPNNVNQRKRFRTLKEIKTLKGGIDTSLIIGQQEKQYFDEIMKALQAVVKEFNELVTRINNIGVLEVDPKKKTDELNYLYFDDRITEQQLVDIQLKVY